MKAITHRSILQKVLGIFIAIAIWCNMHALAQNATKDITVAKLTKYEVKAAHQPSFQKALKDYVQHAIQDESNIMAEAYYEKEHPEILWLIERWTERKASGKLNGTLLSLSETALVKPVEIYFLKDLEPLTKEQWRSAAKTEDEPLNIMLFVDAKNGTQQSFKTIYHKAMPEFRSEPGVVTYQLSEIAGDGTQFVTYEKFRSEAAFQYHLKFPPIQPVIDYLHTSIQKPPFQNGLRNLIEFAPLTRE